MRIQGVFSALAFLATSILPTIARAEPPACRVGDFATALGEANRVLKVQVQGIDQLNEVVDVAHRNVDGSLAIVRGRLAALGDDGTVYLEVDGKLFPFEGVTDLRRADSADSRGMGVLEYRAGDQAPTVVGDTRGAVTRGGKRRDASLASGEIVRPDQYDIDYALLPTRVEISTVGPKSYVEYGSGKTAARVSRIWTDDQGVLHLQVVEPSRRGGGWRTRELSRDELSSVKVSQRSEKEFARYEDVSNVRDHDRVTLAGGSVIGMRGDEAYVSFVPQGERGGQAAKVSRIWQDEKGVFHVEVLEPRPGEKFPRPRELKPEEIATVRAAPEAKPVFARYEPQAAPPKRLEYHYTYTIPGTEVSVSVSGPDSYLKYVPAGTPGAKPLPVKVRSMWTDESGALRIEILEPQVKGGRFLPPHKAPPIVRELAPDEIRRLARSEKSGPANLPEYEHWYESNGPIKEGARGPIKPEYRQAFRRMRNRPGKMMQTDRRVERIAEEVFYDRQAKGLKPPVIDVAEAPGLDGPKLVNEKASAKLDGFYKNATRREGYVQGDWAKRAGKHVELSTASAKSGDVDFSTAVYGGTKRGVSGNPIRKVAFEEDGAKVERIFRPVSATPGSVEAARKTLAASKLNETMGLSTVPRARMAKIDGELGVVSEIAPGRQPGAYFKEEWVDPSSYSDAKGFEFLIGQDDGHLTNFHVSGSIEQGQKIHVYDHNRAFSVGIVQHPPAFKGEFGVSLPGRYTRAFVAGLEKMTLVGLKKSIGPHLTELELESILLRKDILLKDVELRKAAGELVFLD